MTKRIHVNKRISSFTANLLPEPRVGVNFFFVLEHILVVVQCFDYCVEKVVHHYLVHVAVPGLAEADVFKHSQTKRIVHCAAHILQVQSSVHVVYASNLHRLGNRHPHERAEEYWVHSAAVTTTAAPHHAHAQHVPQPAVSAKP